MSKALFAEQRGRGWQGCVSSSLQNLPLQLRLLQLHQELTDRASRNLASGDVQKRIALFWRHTRCLRSWQQGLFFLKREDFSTALCLEANLKTEQGWGLPAFAPISFWWSKQEEAPRRGDLLPSQHCLATLARRNMAWSNTVGLPTWTRCKTSSLGS